MRLHVLVLASIFLAGCGGGGASAPSDPPGGGGVSPLPSPTPTPTRAPAASPTPTHAPGMTPTPTAPPSGTPTPHATPTPTAAASPTPTPKPTVTPTVAPTSTPTGIQILYDTSPATTGVFIGEACVSPHHDDLCVANYAATFRHSLSFFNAFTDWSTDIGSFIASENMAAWTAINVTPLITWDPRGVNYTDVLAGKWDAYMIASAQAMKAFNGTIFLRPFHEFNGDYTSYGLAKQGANTATDARFIKTWQYMVTLFRQQGATNVRWVWCFSNHSVPNDTDNPWNNPVNVYPGDAYVDWIAFDAFNRGSAKSGVPWQTFDQLIAPSYARAIAISPARPLMIAELGSNEWGDGGTLKAQFLSTMLSELPATYPHLRAISYFDLSNTIYSYALQSTVPSGNAWVTGIRSVNASGVLNFRGNGVPFNALTAWQ